MLNIVFYEPEIPFNTGAIARTCGLTQSRLHLIRPLGFSVDDTHLKRAGLDYWHLVDISYYDSYEELVEKYPDNNFYLASTKAKKKYTDVEYKDGDFIVFGPETRGLPEDLIFANYENAIRIPMLKDFGRSLNLSNSANIILFEALRQLDFLDLE
ncbi:tRNA (cytidine(34)-2'-O)-methyltransferase [Peptoniphilus harei]|uniref:Putative tRNA (cytidine(34)-2'-O)-methyltransferase n=1 Tax=Peptoniphilus harei TaxID=54005 RepID=A0A2X1XZJ7_9FIRM|nr:tRNA (cytidine(34)-2'-O)-methyltransferase [Peptoniphilus harei]MBS6534907.1 tRNA (cytidine(34)-2'-O)-methyltransferase [Peptoniphilus harei]MDU2373998.1 tRNA (cytidine(34)-2'-O)-methyltransferase [Peptoniphilus harei]MDU5417982.1 tRNA (cytidine(34)-2'-O)-methyltransferase [Peptoniphilus harei]QQT90608.1 tRNA (cytidine(34)-2'-O)-methyltransferase [Peptoniphilus harei]SPY48079.1 tRNA (cytidine(34)-2'-O)-methyltransferase [Peptoniphilus harei]